MPGKEFFHVLRAYVGCDGKKAGLKECCAKILLSLSDIAENSGSESHELLIGDSNKRNDLKNSGALHDRLLTCGYGVDLLQSIG